MPFPSLFLTWEPVPGLIVASEMQREVTGLRKTFYRLLKPHLLSSCLVTLPCGHWVFERHYHQTEYDLAEGSENVGFYNMSVMCKLITLPK